MDHWSNNAMVSMYRSPLECSLRSDVKRRSCECPWCSRCWVNKLLRYEKSWECERKRSEFILFSGRCLQWRQYRSLYFSYCTIFNRNSIRKQQRSRNNLFTNSIITHTCWFESCRISNEKDKTMPKPHSFINLVTKVNLLMGPPNRNTEPPNLISFNWSRNCWTASFSHWLNQVKGYWSNTHKCKMFFFYSKAKTRNTYGEESNCLIIEILRHKPMNFVTKSLSLNHSVSDWQGHFWAVLNR